MYFKTADVAGLRVFYREAGDPSKPAIVLLHGFPSSSYEFHDLIPRLADRFHVIAPDYRLRRLSLEQELSRSNGFSRST
jgi:pimeloyl-ACP methyl ester carboxylesterase